MSFTFTLIFYPCLLFLFYAFAYNPCLLPLPCTLVFYLCLLPLPCTLAFYLEPFNFAFYPCLLLLSCTFAFYPCLLPLPFTLALYPCLLPLLLPSHVTISLYKIIVCCQLNVGMEGVMWSELIRTPDRLDSMLWPRLLALAERSWHKADWESVDSTVERLAARKEDWTAFANAVGYKELRRLEAIGVKYYLSRPGARWFHTLITLHCYLYYYY